MANKKLNKSVAQLEAENARLQAEVKQLESKLVTDSAAFLSIVGKSLDGILIVNQDQMVVYANDAAMTLFDKNIADLLGEPLHLSLDPMVLANQKKAATEIHLPQPDSKRKIAELSILMTDWKNEPCYVMSFRDITERKKTEEILAYMAEHDVMTNLPNRIAFEKNLSEAIHEAMSREEHMAMLYLDLDNFKLVNDTLGHQAGDELLKQVAALLKENTRKGDTVARLGGDEFALILTSLRKPEYAGGVSEKLIQKMQVPFNLDGHQVYCHMSIGIAVYPLSAKTAVDLIKYADMAMYAAKYNGKNQHRFYSETLNEKEERSLQVSTRLRSAIQKKELFVEYQPIINLETGVCHGVEALVRWKHPKLGILYPDEFLKEAKKMNLMISIGKWVTRKVFSEFKQLDKLPVLFVSVNMAADELTDTNMLKSILKARDEFDIDIKKVIFELTEKSFVKNPETFTAIPA
jgi:diguanylate cyclase (GGDEF)-like protein